MSHTQHKRKIAFILLCLLLLFASVPSAGAFGVGSKGPDVYAAQGMLKSLGYLPGKIDGIYGAQTKRAVQLFQKAYGLPVTGAVDDQTLQSILWAYGNAKKPKAKPPAPMPKPPAKEPAGPIVSPLSAEERQMVQLVNQERTKQGLKPLIIDTELARVARIKSQDMADKNYFSHTSPTYGSPFEMMKKFGITYSTAGENIACNQSVAKAHDALMNSPGHRKNILSPDFTHIGIGIVQGGPCGKMFTQMFVGRK
jgi:uncharacterized YkwD family protein